MTARFTINRIGGVAVAGYPDDLTGFGTNNSVWVVWDANANAGRTGESTNTATMELLSGGLPFGVNGLSFQITDVDTTDNDNASDRCDFVTATGNVGNPSLTYVSPTVASRTVRIGVQSGSGLTGILAANQAQCIYNTGATTSPTSNGDDFGSILATFPSGTSTATIAYDESIENVYNTNRDAAARGIGVWGATLATVNNSISLAKSTTATRFFAGQIISYDYTVTNNGPLPINTNQNILIQDDKIGTFACGTISASIPSGGTHTCSASYTVTAADLNSTSLTNIAVAGLGTGSQSFATRLQSNSATVALPRAPTISLVKALGSNRVTDTDQATVAIRTGGVSGTVVNSTANSTTAGTGNTVTAGTGTTGTYTATAGTAYTLTESASGTTIFQQYTAAVTCTDSAGLQTGLPSAVAYNMASGLTITPVAGAVISCSITNTAKAPTISLTKSLGANRATNTDQFTVAIRTGGVSGTVVNSTANSTTAGTGNAVTSGTGTTGAFTATAGTAYTLTESASGTTNFTQYNSTITCTDSAGLQSVLPSGAVYSVAAGLSITPVAGAVISCAITNTAVFADLVVTKTDGVASVNAGGTTTYTVRVTNNGPTSVTGATLSDPAATGLSKTSVACSPTPGQCSAAPTVAQIEGGAFALPAIASGQFYEVRIVASVTATSGTVANAATATVPVGTTDPNTANNTGVTDTNTVNPVADLVVTKTDGVASVNAGGTTTYTVRVTNNGPSSVTGATLSDPAATGLSKTSVACSPTPGQCATAPTVAQIEGGAFALPAIASGQFYEVRIAASVTATSGTVANAATATVPVGTTDPNSANNTSITDTNTVTPIPVLTLVKTVINTGGGNATASEWTLSASGGATTITGSTGTATVTNASIPIGTYALSESGIPAGYDSNDYVASTYSCVVNAGASVSGNSLTLVHGDVATCTITNTFVPDSSMTIDKRALAGTPLPLQANQTVTFEYVVSNNGNVTLNGVNVVEDAFNGGAGPVELTPTGGLSTLTPGQTTIFTATYTLTQADVEALQ